MTHKLLIAAVGLGMLLCPATAFAQNECNADIRGTLMRKEAGSINTKFSAKIDVSARETCAMIYFDLIVVEAESGGKEFEVRVSKRVRVRDSAVSSLKLNYTLTKGRTIASHRFEQTRCQICE